MTDEIKSLVVKFLLLGLTALATQLHANLGVASLTAIAADLADLLVLGYSIYTHRGMKKVPETAIVVGQQEGGK